MDNYFENHILYKRAMNDKKGTFCAIEKQYNKDLSRYLHKFKNAKVLEIGSGMGKFAYFCNKIGVKDYTGIDIDDYFFDENKKDFPNYTFIKVGFQEFLKKHQNEFDIIFVSHVLEHLDEKERVDMVEGIYNGLKENGIWINYMPNGDNLLRFGFCRYGDLTHKFIYTDISFDQLVKSTKCDFKIENFNIYIGGNSKIKRLIHLFIRRITKIYFLGMGQIFPEFYTWEFINVLTKEGKN